MGNGEFDVNDPWFSGPENEPVEDQVVRPDFQGMLDEIQRLHNDQIPIEQIEDGMEFLTDHPKLARDALERVSEYGLAETIVLRELAQIGLLHEFSGSWGTLEERHQVKFKIRKDEERADAWGGGTRRGRTGASFNRLDRSIRSGIPLVEDTMPLWVLARTGHIPASFQDLVHELSHAAVNPRTWGGRVMDILRRSSIDYLEDALAFTREYGGVSNLSARKEDLQTRSYLPVPPSRKINTLARYKTSPLLKALNMVVGTKEQEDRKQAQRLETAVTSSSLFNRLGARKKELIAALQESPLGAPHRYVMELQRKMNASRRDKPIAAFREIDTMFALGFTGDEMVDLVRNPGEWRNGGWVHVEGAISERIQNRGLSKNDVENLILERRIRMELDRQKLRHFTQRLIVSYVKK